MLSVHTMCTWIEKYNLGSIAGAEMIDEMIGKIVFETKSD